MTKHGINNFIKYTTNYVVKTQGRQYRSNDPCAYCGKIEEDMTWDHIVPHSDGGTRKTENLIRACEPCNQDKRSKSLLVHLLTR